jgi:hypothetical protein
MQSWVIGIKRVFHAVCRVQATALLRPLLYPWCYDSWKCILSPWSRICASQSEPVSAGCNNPHLPSAFRSVKGMSKQDTAFRLHKHVPWFQPCLLTECQNFNSKAVCMFDCISSPIFIAIHKLLILLNTWGSKSHFHEYEFHIRIRSSGIWPCVTGLLVLDLSMERSAFLFRVEQSESFFLDSEDGSTMFLQTAGKLAPPDTV